MANRLRRTSADDQAKRIRRKSGRADGLSPTLELELTAAMEHLQGVKKPEGAANALKLSRSVYYELLEHPLDLTIAELLRLQVSSTDKGLGSRIRGHLAALDAYKSFAEQEAQHTYNRIQDGQRALFGGKR